MTAHDIGKLVRPEQWTKNLFVLSPLFFGKAFAEPILAVRTVATAFIFCVMASAVYIFNDIADVERDRAHPTKCQRPIASGTLSIPVAWILFVALALATLVGAFFLNHELAGILTAYLAVNVTYSLYLKRVAILDAFCISSGFILRVLAGGAVSGVVVSHWLLLCTMTLSLFLAFGKRREEMSALAKNPSHQRPSLKGYSLPFLDHAISTVATLTMICYILYVVDPQTTRFFGTRAVLLTSVFVLYGIFHYLSLLQVQEKGGNPATILLSDRHLQLACLGWVVTWMVIIFNT
jgi:4-hydroxybenzoate polyprenyltransferase